MCDITQWTFNSAWKRQEYRTCVTICLQFDVTLGLNLVRGEMLRNEAREIYLGIYTTFSVTAMLN